MDSHGDHVCGEVCSDSVFEGDCYRQDDEHTRSADPSATAEIVSGVIFGEFSTERNAKHRFGGMQVASHASHIWFGEGNSAPLLPTDPLFRLEATTVFIGDGCSSAVDIANRLAACFDAEATATIIKVSPAKFAFKAEIECQGFRCELKARVYRQETGHVVEFQRRDGDAFVFAGIYQRTASQLMQVWASHNAPFPGEVTADTELVILPPLQIFQDVH